MKGSVLTGKTWLLLIVAALLITAGVLNFSQRLSHRPPPWEGLPGLTHRREWSPRQSMRVRPPPAPR